MDAFGGNGHFGAEPELSAVGETGARIGVNRRRVHLGQKPGDRLAILGEDPIGVPGAMTSDVGKRLIDPVHDLETEDQRQPFAIEVPGPAGSTPGIPPSSSCA